MKIKIASIVVALAAAGILVTANLRPKTVQSAETPGAAAAPGTTEMVAAAGRVEPVSEEVVIGSELNGKLRQVPVEEGDRVHRGQAIAVLENGDYAARVALAEADLLRLTAVQRKVTNGARREERAEAEAGVVEARAVLANAKADLSRRESLFRSGDIARADMDRVEREVAVAHARLEAAVQRRTLIDSDTREEDRVSASADVARARAQIAEAKALLAKTIIRSPIDGVVLRKHLKTGESVSNEGNNPILTLGDDSTLRVRVDVDEADVARVQVGQTAYVTAEAYGKRRFTGTVVRISQVLGKKNIRTDAPSERVDRKVLETLVELQKGHKLPAGLRVDAFIQAPRV